MDARVAKKILEFIKERELLRISQDELYDGPGYLTENREVKFSPFIQHTVDWCPVTRTIKRRGVQLAEAQGDAAVAALPVPADEIWEVVNILGYLDAAGVVAARACGITIAEASVILAMVIPTTQLTAIAVAADEVGVMTLGHGPIHHTWTTAAGYGIVADENPLPKTLYGGSTVNMVSTNLNIGDVTTVQVLYKRVD